ncbi:MAG TPA: alpha-hydroxy acid oxidase [Nocardioidaceae bacterium]|nr:alpha-hydroxy acid oxidase [Nocardioidaceae bacterium]
MSQWADSLERLAGEVLPEPVYRYFRQGARDGVSAGEASAAWDRYRFLPSVLRDVTEVDCSTTALGTSLSSPLAIAPTTLQRAAHPEGELAMARAVAQAGSLLVVSSNSGSTFEEIAATGVRWWLQAYVPADREACKPLLRRAVEAGARAVVLTADTPVVGVKYDGAAATVWDVVDPALLRVNFRPPPVDSLGHASGDSLGDLKATDLGPADIARLGEETGLPVVVKGVLRPEDARRCVEAGAAAIWVSNHGGRQLDYAAATAHCLAAVADEVGSDAEVYVDGGVRSARHVLSAVSLGARAVFLGRLPLYALAVDGGDGVARLLAELGAELEDAMRLVGVSGLNACHPQGSGLHVQDVTDRSAEHPMGP